MENKRNNYSKAYYQNNKEKFRQYYKNYKLKKQQIANGTYVPPVKEDKPKRSKYDILKARFDKIHQNYLKRREDWLKENGLDTNPK
jgi:hypothetical protein